MDQAPQFLANLGGRLFIFLMILRIGEAIHKQFRELETMIGWTQPSFTVANGAGGREADQGNYRMHQRGILA